jgi:methionyl aminopeptidase
VIPIVKTYSEQIKLRNSSKIVAEIHNKLKEMVVPGMVLKELEAVAIDIIKQHKATASFLGYRGYQYSICTSINEEIVHGFPTERIIQEGDVVSIDVGVYKDDYHGDAAFTKIAGTPKNIEDILLVRTTKHCLYKAICNIKEGTAVGDIGTIIEDTAKLEGFDVVKNYVGHGIGRSLHETPQIINYTPTHRGLLLKAGMVICIEPMLTIGSSKNHVKNDNWTVITDTKNNAAHFEHQIIIHKDKAEIISVF